jgi:hypothetical protein
MAEEKSMPVYNLKVKGQDGNMYDKKAIDLNELNDWLDSMMVSNNVLYVTDDKIDEMSIKDFKGLVYRNIVGELNLMVKKSLGLIDEPRPETHEAKQEAPKKRPAMKKEVEPEIIEDEMPEPTGDEDDVIVLDK